MPISVKRDIKRAFSLGDRFFLGDTPVFVGLGGGQSYYYRDVKGPYLKQVKEDIAIQNWNDFHKDSQLSALKTELIVSGVAATLAATLLVASGSVILSLSALLLEGGIVTLLAKNADRNIAKSNARKFELLPNEEAKFDELWVLQDASLAYKSDVAVKIGIETDIANAYLLVAKIAAGTIKTNELINKPTLSRIGTPRTDGSFVIFSDFHMTAFDVAGKSDYFFDFNYVLYQNVLKTYYSKLGYCLVENGDVEDCLLSQFTLSEAQLRNSSAPNNPKSQFPVKPGNTWGSFLKVRYNKRLSNLTKIISKYAGYYKMIREDFISKGKYVRITGNHDTYLDNAMERELKTNIEAQLNLGIAPDKKIQVQDVLTIKVLGTTKYVVMHGHQFDPESVQHGSIPYAQSMGEMNSENVAWCMEGADRIWELDDSKKWYIGNTPLNQSVVTKGNFQNMLARQIPLAYQNGGNGFYDLLMSNTNKIKEDTKGFVETIVGHEIAWEYFENTESGWHDFTLENVIGDEGFKMRHMNEIALCDHYRAHCLAEMKLVDDNTPKTLALIPKLIIGHTHEPRQNSSKVFQPSSVIPPAVPSQVDLYVGPYGWYLNSGAAGRYENLIWCIEIVLGMDHICSWSMVEGKLRKIVWKSDGGDLLIHDHIEEFEI